MVLTMLSNAWCLQEEVAGCQHERLQCLRELMDAKFPLKLDTTNSYSKRNVITSNSVLS